MSSVSQDRIEIIRDYPDTEIPDVAPKASVVLVNMPWARTDAPSIQCGTLQAVLRRAGHRTKSCYPNLELSSLLGPELYQAIMNAPAERVHLLGEWLFGTAAFEVTGDEEGYRQEFPEMDDLLIAANCTWQTLVELRSTRLPAWLDQLAARPEWADYDLVGFTSTFAQNVAALALAKRLKARLPDLVTVFGGANYDDVMGPEYLRKLPYIDYAVIGEGDISLPLLATAVATGKGPAGIGGVCYRDDDGQVVTQAPEGPLRDMDSLPTPDYGDYFSELVKIGKKKVTGERPVRLLVELSRGCWWGQKHHCTFCGLNSLGMAFRSKSSEVAVREIAHLMTQHKVHIIDAVDNIIEMSYLGTFCRDLADSGWDVDMFFEVKANLTAAQLAVLASAGIRRIQPGIESLNSNILRLMRKGSTMLINVRLLKWARYHGLDVMWNILMGFPGETDQDYQRQADLIPRLAHLQPPESCAPLWLERFSPYFRDDSFPISDITARSAYRYAYPVDGLDYEKIAYFFDYSVTDVASAQAHNRVRVAVSAWRAAWESEQRPTLAYRKGPGWLQLIDNRSGHWRKALLAGWRGIAYEAIDTTARSAARVAETLARHGERVDRAQVDEFLTSLVNHGVAIEEDRRFFGLAVPVRTGQARPRELAGDDQAAAADLDGRLLPVLSR